MTWGAYTTLILPSSSLAEDFCFVGSTNVSSIKRNQRNLSFPVSFVVRHGQVTHFQPEKCKWKSALNFWESFPSLMPHFLCHSVPSFCLECGCEPEGGAAMLWHEATMSGKTERTGHRRCCRPPPLLWAAHLSSSCNGRKTNICLVKPRWKCNIQPGFSLP